MIRTSLVPLTAEMPDEALLDAALVLARKGNAQFVRCSCCPTPMPLLPTFPI
jgi:hypothetical protein